MRSFQSSHQITRSLGQINRISKFPMTCTRLEHRKTQPNIERPSGDAKDATEASAATFRVHGKRGAGRISSFGNVKKHAVDREWRQAENKAIMDDFNLHEQPSSGDVQEIAIPYQGDALGSKVVAYAGSDLYEQIRIISLLCQLKASVQAKGRHEDLQLLRSKVTMQPTIISISRTFQGCQ